MLVVFAMYFVKVVVLCFKLIFLLKFQWAAHGVMRLIAINFFIMLTTIFFNIDFHVWCLARVTGKITSVLTPMRAHTRLKLCLTIWFPIRFACFTTRHFLSCFITCYFACAELFFNLHLTHNCITSTFAPKVLARGHISEAWTPSSTLEYVATSI